MLGRAERVRTAIEYLLIVSTGVISLLIAILDLTGLLDANSWVALRVPSLTLLAVGFIASYLILERKGKIDTIANTLERNRAEMLEAIASSSTGTIRALGGVEIVSFTSSAEYLSYATKRIRRATRVDDITWGRPAYPRSVRDDRAFDEYADALSVAARNPHFIIRKVVSFHSMSQFEQERRRILEEDNVGYSLGYYKTPSSDEPRREGFAVIDREEVLISHSPKSIWLSVKHPIIVSYYLGYFEEIWEHSEKLKQGKTVEQEKLQRLETELRQRFQI